MNVHKIAWGLALILIGLAKAGAQMELLAFGAGIALIVAGVAYIAGI